MTKLSPSSILVILRSIYGERSDLLRRRKLVEWETAKLAGLEKACIECDAILLETFAERFQCTPERIADFRDRYGFMGLEEALETGTLERTIVRKETK